MDDMEVIGLHFVLFLDTFNYFVTELCMQKTLYS